MYGISPAMKLFLLTLAAMLTSFGTLIAAGARDPYVLLGGAASSIGTAILGFFMQPPQKVWTDEQRAARLGTPAPNTPDVPETQPTEKEKQ